MKGPWPVVCAFLGSALLGACSDSSSLRNVEVTYRFENVRRRAGLDEWASIRKVLEDHSVRAVVDDQKNAKPGTRNDVRTVQATVVVESLADLDAIQAGIEELSETIVAGDKVQFSLVSTALTYRSNVVAATLTVTLNGVANPGFIIKLYVGEASMPYKAVSGKNGLWSRTLKVVPEERYVYGVSLDPSRKVQPRYFRINVSTLAQEAVDDSEFLGTYPRATDLSETGVGETPAKPPAKAGTPGKK